MPYVTDSRSLQGYIVQHGQQQAHTVQDPAAHTSVDTSQMQAFVNYPNNLVYDPTTAAAYGGHPIQHTYSTDLATTYGTLASNSAQSYPHGAPLTYGPQSTYRMLTMIAFRLVSEHRV
jgi:hypothetical protein